MQQGVGYVGASDLLTSTANIEVVPAAPGGWTSGYSLYKFSFTNDQACHVKINGGNAVFLRANQGFNIDQQDKAITSFIIVESGITYNFIGAF